MFLSLSGFAASTVQLYLVGVRHHLKLRGQNCFNNSFIIRMVVKGVLTRFPEPDVCLPITLELLTDMWDILPYIVHDRFQITMFHYMLTLGYHGLLRPVEITYSPHMVKVENIYFVLLSYCQLLIKHLLGWLACPPALCHTYFIPFKLMVQVVSYTFQLLK